ncbi:MAG: hypothetical protein H0X63_12970, partial [Flavobacteriales bacterium]|nr:hypothetical protein [Flavobacteriales bacterium]
SEAYWNENYREDFINYYSNLNAQEKIDYFNALAQGRQAFLGGAYDLTAHLLSTTGDATTLVGYGLTLTGVGASVGVPLMTLGKGMSSIGGAMYSLHSFKQGDISGGLIHGGGVALGFGASNFFTKSKFARDNFGKLGGNILDGNANLKISGVSKILNGDY